MKAFTLLFNTDKLYQKIIDINIANGVNLEVITKQHTDYIFAPRQLSDIERMYHLKNNPNLIYMDADAVMIKEPDFMLEEGFPYLYCQNGIYDSCVIIGNGCQWFFDYIYEKFNKEKPIDLWYFPLINGELKSKIKPIPYGYFRHFAFDSARIASQRGNRIISMGYSLQLKNGEYDVQFFPNVL